jgi:hypothetical protein
MSPQLADASGNSTALLFVIVVVPLEVDAELNAIVGRYE